MPSASLQLGKRRRRLCGCKSVGLSVGVFLTRHTCRVLATDGQVIAVDQFGAATTPIRALWLVGSLGAAGLKCWSQLLQEGLAVLTLCSAALLPYYSYLIPGVGLCYVVGRIIDKDEMAYASPEV